MARLSRLNGLRLTFVGLGVVLLLPLYVLKGAIDRRIASQARLRHEVVAERIFDEFERELTRVIERESMRPSSAYDATTDPGTWAPFVLGYFTLDATGSRFSPGLSLDPPRRAVIESRLRSLLTPVRTPPSEAARMEPPAERQLDREQGVTPKRKFTRDSPSVLQQLNVGSERKARPSSASKPKSSDPMQDYAF